MILGVSVFVILALLGLSKRVKNYQDSINGREHPPKWECLWSDLVQEEIRLRTKDGTSYKHDDEQNCALAGKVKKGKGNKFQSK